MQQEKFARAWVENHNASKAAIAAGYSINGAGVAGSRLLKLPQVIAYIKDYERKVVKMTQATEARTVSEIARRAYFRFSNFFRVNPETEQIEFDLANATMSDIDCLTEYVVETTTAKSGATTRRVKVKVCPQDTYLLALAKIHGLMNDGGNVTFNVSVLSNDELLRFRELMAKMSESKMSNRSLPEIADDAIDVEFESESNAETERELSAELFGNPEGNIDGDQEPGEVAKENPPRVTEKNVTIGSKNFGDIPPSSVPISDDQGSTGTAGPESAASGTESRTPLDDSWFD